MTPGAEDHVESSKWPNVDAFIAACDADWRCGQSFGSIAIDRVNSALAKFRAPDNEIVAVLLEATALFRRAIDGAASNVEDARAATNTIRAHETELRELSHAGGLTTDGERRRREIESQMRVTLANRAELVRRWIEFTDSLEGLATLTEDALKSGDGVPLESQVTRCFDLMRRVAESPE